MIVTFCDCHTGVSCKILEERTSGLQSQLQVHDLNGPPQVSFCSPEGLQIQPHTTSSLRMLTPAPRDPLEAYAALLRPYYAEHCLFPPDQWPPGLSTVYTNLSLVRHDKIPVKSSLNQFEKATLHGSIDDLCFNKYSIELHQILKPDSFFFKKEGELKQENKQYEQQLIRLLNQSVPDEMKKRLNIPFDDGKGLPNVEEVRDVLKQPKFFRSPQLRKLVMERKTDEHKVKDKEGVAATMRFTPNQLHLSQTEPVLPKHNVSHNCLIQPTDSAQPLSNDSLPPDQNGIKVLIDGAPGVGKTTLTWKISKDWVTGDLFKEFKIVIRISLRDLPQDSQKVHQILPLGSEQLRIAVENELIDSNGNKAILILDGWDELSPNQRKKGSLLYKLILGELLPQSTVIITSRPYTSRWLQLPQMVPRHIELCGFTQDQVKSCIRNEYSYFPETAELLIQLLEVRTDIFKLCYIPNNLSIVIHIFRTSENRLPDTLTALYQLYVHSAKVRYMQNQYDDPEAALSLEDEAQFPKEVNALYHSLCEVAFSGLNNNKFVFKESELKEFNPLLVEGANTLGLMTAYKSFTPTAIVKSFQFIHGTIQEFLAADAISMLPPDQQENFILEHINGTQFRMVLLFYAGHTSLSGLKDILKVPMSYEGQLNIDRLLLLIRMLFEAQNPRLCQILAQSFPDSSLQLSSLVSIDMHTISEFDVHVLKYLLRHSSHLWNMLDPYETHLEKLLTPFVHTTSNPSLEELHINATASENVYKTLSQSSFQSLKAVKITLKCPLSETASSFLASLCTLTHLHFDCFTQGSLDTAMEAASNCQHLQYLGLKMKTKDHMDIKDNSLKLSSTFPIVRAHTFSFSCEGFIVTDEFADSISHKLCDSENFEGLYFKDCSFSSNQLYSLFSSLQSNLTIKTLHIRGFYSLQWSAGAASALKEMISFNSSVTDLRLAHFSLDANVTIGIAEALKHNRILTTLDLSFNRNIDNIGIIIDSIKELQSLQILKLEECGLENHVQLLANFLSSQCCEVKELDISCNRINDKGGSTLFVALTDNQSLEVLNMNGNPLWLKEGKVIETLVKRNTTLRELYLENSGLHLPAIEGVASGISKNSSLRSLHLGVSLKQTPEGACAIFEALGKNVSLQRLSLSAYKLGDEGTKAAAEALRQNNALVSLSLNRCEFGTPESLQSLIAVLYSHKSLQEIRIPTTNSVFQRVFSEYDRINWCRANENLPYLNVIESGPPLMKVDVEKLLR